MAAEIDEYEDLEEDDVDLSDGDFNYSIEDEDFYDDDDWIYDDAMSGRTPNDDRSDSMNLTVIATIPKVIVVFANDSQWYVQIVSRYEHQSNQVNQSEPIYSP